MLNIKDLHDILFFLNKAQLTGNEAPLLVSLMQKLTEAVKRAEEKNKEEQDRSDPEVLS